MAATVFDVNTVTFGTTSETGGYLQNFSVTKNVEKAVVLDEDGDTVAVGYYDPKETIEGEAVLYGTTGLGAIAPAASLTLSSYSPTAGLILVEEVSTKYSNTDFKRVSFKAMVYPLITS